jgi:diguanylate cyclase (GGDEF)-like protein
MGWPGTRPGAREMPTSIQTMMDLRHKLLAGPTGGVSTSGTWPFSRESLFRQVGPLVGGTLMGLLVLALPHTQDPQQMRYMLRAATLTALTVTATALLPWNRLPSMLQAAPPVLYMVVAFLLGEANGGAAHSIYEQLVLLPVLWLAVYGTSLELALGLVAVSAVLIAPLAVPGASGVDWQRTASLILVAAVLGFAVHSLLKQIRLQANRLGVLALTDELTGAANRRAWNEYLAGALRVDDTNSATPLVCVAVLDVDHFKEYNDRHGHQGGDRFLKELTACWRARLRDSDVLARLGGDEFAILLPNCERTVAANIVERLCSDLPAGRTCSAGLVAWDGAEGADALVARADGAMYQAKNAGRNRIVAAH